MTLPSAFPDDDDPRTFTLVGTPPGRAPAIAPLPDVHSCTVSEFYGCCAGAVHSKAERDQLARSDLHVHAALSKMLALAAENETLRQQLEALQGQAQAFRAASQRDAAAALGSAGYAKQLLEHNEQLRRDAIRARDCVRSMAHQLGGALAELGTKDAELELLRSFDRASRAITGQSAATLSVQLAGQQVPPATDNPFAEPATSRPAWCAHGTEPDNEAIDLDTIVVDPSLEGDLL